MERLATVASQPSLTQAELAALVSDMTWLKAQLADLQGSNGDSQRQLVSIDGEGFYPPSSDAAQPETREPSLLPGVKASGFVDASNYTNHNVGESSFGLDQVEIDIVKEFSDRASVRADIECVNDGQGGFSFDLEQGFMTWNAGDAWKWSFTFGKFNAPIGFETVDPTGMYQYSFGLVAAYCVPSNLTGVMVSLSAPSVVTWSLYAVNGWDVNTDNNKDKTLGTRFGFNAAENLSFGLSAITGPELDDNNSRRRSVLDFDLTFHPLPLWTVGAELNTGWESKVAVDGGTAQWGGGLLTNNFQLTSRYGLTVRMDYLNDRDGSRTTVPQKIKAVCVSPSVKIADGLGALFEVRYDWSNRDSFVSDDGHGRNHQATTAFEFTYGF